MARFTVSMTEMPIVIEHELASHTTRRGTRNRLVFRYDIERDVALWLVCVGPNEGVYYTLQEAVEAYNEEA